MRVAFTIPWWLLIGYPTVGLVLWLPLEYLAYRRIHRPPFWRELWRGVKRRPYIPLRIMVVWPRVLWEAKR